MERGRLISTPDRQEMMSLIDETVASGARKHKACEILGISLRTLQRWQIRLADGRADAVRPEPSRDKVKSGVWPVCSMMRQAASFC